ncbi:hypothetical protein ACFPM1_11580 [Halorubrum rubrum]|uniref:Uncharacterized protein n=1 Tax=Halorubrum rubrum TaxID=1126240 RepID=A0ABD5R3G3_9EURY|nr:hypothetical protein [Halorubrum rubrum]
MAAHNTATRKTIDVRDLGFEPGGSFGTDVDVHVDDSDDGTFVEVTYEEWVWTLEFDRYGDLTDAPTQSAPRWLGPVIKKAAPQLRVT